MTERISFFEMFSDPLFRGPLLGSLFMSFSTALVGAITFIRKKSLIGETLSHATFPGVALGMLVAGMIFPQSDKMAFLFILLGAFFTGLLGQYIVEKMLKAKKQADVSLCYVLATFLGLGVLLASFMQQVHVMWYRKIQIFFYGQAATMTDLHIYVYGILSLLVSLVVFFLIRAISSTCFDPIFSQSIGINPNLMTRCCLILLTLSVVIGIRSVGVVLITGMLIAPAIVAKAFTRKFSSFLMLSAFVGVISAAIGNYISLIGLGVNHKHYLPTGPATVVVASILAFLALLFSPYQGVLIKQFRRWGFQKSCVLENLLKTFWKNQDKGFSFKEIKAKKIADEFILSFALYQLVRKGFLKKEGKGLYLLTEDGKKKAAYIVRLHRLWELYLIEYLSSEIEKVHQSAEEMEHLITPEIEDKLTKILLNPTQDPHHQPIPNKDFL